MKLQESPHEHQQSQLLSRIITNVVWNFNSDKPTRDTL